MEILARKRIGCGMSLTSSWVGLAVKVNAEAIEDNLQITKGQFVNVLARRQDDSLSKSLLFFPSPLLFVIW